MGNFDQNTKMGFIVNYSDIVGIPSKIFSPDPESIQNGNSEQIELIYYIQIDLYNTGYIYLAEEKIKKKMENLKKKGRSLASFCIKINRKNLLNELLLNEEREVIAEKIIAHIIKGKNEVLKIPKEEQSITNIPCFDINFKNILLTEQELENEQKKGDFFKEEIKENNEDDDKENNDFIDLDEDEIKEKEPEIEIEETNFNESSPIKHKARSLEIIENEKNLAVNADAIREKFPQIKEYFGVCERIKKMEKLNNQSMQPLDFLFPEIEKTEEEIIQASKTVLDKSKNQDKRHNVKLINFEENEPKFSVMHPGSDILSEWLKEKVIFLFDQNSLKQ